MADVQKWAQTSAISVPVLQGTEAHYTPLSTFSTQDDHFDMVHIDLV